MPLIVWGIHYETAPLALREQVAVRHHDLAELLQYLSNYLQEVVALTTCHRSEWYCFADDPSLILTKLADYYQLSVSTLQEYGYCYTEAAAVEHLLRVSCGLNSMVLGEPQIFGQVKNAFQQACQIGCVGPYMQFLFRQVFAATKRIRHQSAISENPVSVASAALNLAKCIFTDIHQLHIVLIGINEMTLSALKYFYQSGASSITLANRTFSKAEALCTTYSATPVRLDQLVPVLSQANLVISATASATPIVTETMLQQALQCPRQRPLLLLDLAMPRDIEPGAAQFDFVYLYNIDDLQRITTQGLEKRKVQAKYAEKLIAQEVAHYQKLVSERRFNGMIRAYREQVEAIRAQELDKALRALANGQDPAAVMQGLARTLTNKLMHQPSVQLRHASYHGHIEVLEAAKRLLGIGGPLSEDWQLDPIE